METPAILGSLRIPVSAALSAPALSSALSNALAGQVIEATLEAVLPEGLLLRTADGKQLQAQGSLPFPPGSTLALKALPLPEGAGVRLQVIRATPPPSPALLAPLAQGEAAPLMARLQTGAAQTPLADLLRNLLRAGATVAEQPETWSTWMKEAMKTLSDPTASPAESAFHRLQAKEGTAWFEVPLPWAPGAEPMRIWIEGEGEASGREADAVHRVFLSVPFSTLGEVRLGLEQRSAGLRARLWLAHPDEIAALRPELEAELASLGRPVDLQILALPPDSPDLRALAGAQPIQALG
ncbi:hypothetical protein GETHLI_27580 [Geothrix limicola]|uniref:Flagellar hook-length control protein-like C-terminal domain-containing protein n=1 Tax=Geothrix limicola TaxID=2927978 RepID=A0ABQ5QIM9_9BACT|nr:hypothetical protein [Geothrix limicola]GLH74256.1 hypothetical protein GETHLI_27580 [Geothrix limicola]